MRKDGSWVKSQRLAEISRTIASTMPKGCDYEKLLIKIQFEMGLTVNRAEEYVDLVCLAKGWINNNGIIKGE